jgi:alginate O-acetyltransferase complex protein AlgI
MLFNSYPFIFLFLPAVLLGYFATGRYGNRGPVIWLVLASVAFYAFGNWRFVSLLLASIASNYRIGLLLCLLSRRQQGVGADRTSDLLT